MFDVRSQMSHASPFVKELFEPFQPEGNTPNQRHPVRPTDRSSLAIP